MFIAWSNNTPEDLHKPNEGLEISMLVDFTCVHSRTIIAAKAIPVGDQYQLGVVSYTAISKGHQKTTRLFYTS